MTDMVFGNMAAKPGEPVLSHWWRTIDRWSMGAVFFLFCLGILLAMAASPPLAERNGLPPFYYVTRQLVFGVTALAAMAIVSMLTPRQIRRWATIGFFAAALAIALLPFFGTDFGKGAIRWYSFGFGSFQPSEFLKPAFVVFVAWLMSASHDIAGPPGKFISFVVTAFLAFLLAMQPDYGQAALILATWAVMYFVAGASLTLLVLFAGVSISAAMFAYSASEHVARRIDGFLISEVDPRTQIGYATDAIREGGFFGAGIGEGSVKWSLPDAHTDFIIAVAAEEYGLILCVVIIGLFLTITLRSMFRLVRERDTFVRIAGTGLAGLIGMQAIINMGVAVRLLPAKGMTLPFVSYGGSSLIAIGLLLGALFSLTRRRPQDDLGDYIGIARR